MIIARLFSVICPYDCDDCDLCASGICERTGEEVLGLYDSCASLYVATVRYVACCFDQESDKD